MANKQKANQRGSPGKAADTNNVNKTASPKAATAAAGNNNAAPAQQQQQKKNEAPPQSDPIAPNQNNKVNGSATSRPAASAKQSSNAVVGKQQPNGYHDDSRRREPGLVNGKRNDVVSPAAGSPSSTVHLQANGNNSQQYDDKNRVYSGSNSDNKKNGNYYQGSRMRPHTTKPVAAATAAPNGTTPAHNYAYRVFTNQNFLNQQQQQQLQRRASSSSQHSSTTMKNPSAPSSGTQQQPYYDNKGRNGVCRNSTGRMQYQHYPMNGEQFSPKSEEKPVLSKPPPKRIVWGDPAVPSFSSVCAGTINLKALKQQQAQARVTPAGDQVPAATATPTTTYEAKLSVLDQTVITTSSIPVAATSVPAAELHAHSPRPSQSFQLEIDPSAVVLSNHNSSSSLSSPASGNYKSVAPSNDTFPDTEPLQVDDGTARMEEASNTQSSFKQYYNENNNNSPPHHQKHQQPHGSSASADLTIFYDSDIAAASRNSSHNNNSSKLQSSMSDVISEEEITTTSCNTNNNNNGAVPLPVTTTSTTTSTATAAPADSGYYAAAETTSLVSSSDVMSSLSRAASRSAIRLRAIGATVENTTNSMHDYRHQPQQQYANGGGVYACGSFTAANNNTATTTMPQLAAFRHLQPAPRMPMPKLMPSTAAANYYFQSNAAPTPANNTQLVNGYYYANSNANTVVVSPSNVVVTATVALAPPPPSSIDISSVQVLAAPQLPPPSPVVYAVPAQQHQYVQSSVTKVDDRRSVNSAADGAAGKSFLPNNASAVLSHDIATTNGFSTDAALRRRKNNRKSSESKQQQRKLPLPPHQTASAVEYSVNGGGGDYYAEEHVMFTQPSAAVAVTNNNNFNDTTYFRPNQVLHLLNSNNHVVDGIDNTKKNPPPPLPSPDTMAQFMRSFCGGINPNELRQVFDAEYNKTLYAAPYQFDWFRFFAELERRRRDPNYRNNNNNGIIFNGVEGVLRN